VTAFSLCRFALGLPQEAEMSDAASFSRIDARLNEAQARSVSCTDEGEAGDAAISGRCTEVGFSLHADVVAINCDAGVLSEAPLLLCRH
jgi:hypothetical protein